MNININTKEYWEKRFSSTDWEEKKGRWQTESFAKGQINFLKINSDFSGTFVDFGCGLGDAMPVYKEYFPNAKLIGIDISQNAIDKCKKKYGEIATFFQGDHSHVPEVNIIIASNVFEHLDDDINIAKYLLSKCESLYVIVPYKEYPLCSEHVNVYDEHHFSTIGEYDYKVFPCIGWSQYGIKKLWYDIFFKNILRLLTGKKLRHRAMQIIFRF